MITQMPLLTVGRLVLALKTLFKSWQSLVKSHAHNITIKFEDKSKLMRRLTSGVMKYLEELTP